MKQIKLWQEEIKLTVMFFGAVASVGTFFYKLFHGGLFAVAEKAAPVVRHGIHTGRANAVRELAREHFASTRLSETVAVSSSSSVDVTAIVLGAFSVILLGLFVYFLVVVLKKHMCKI